jgi:hypothetical protein
MKSLNNYILESKETVQPKESGQIISLEGIDEEFTSKINNLNEAPIYECCGCGCCCEPEPCDPTCGKCCDISGKSFGFTSEYQVVDRLSCIPVVDDLYQIHWQFGNKFMFHPENEPEIKEPLYFNGSVEYSVPRIHKEPTVNKLDNTIVPFNKSKKLYDFIKDLCSTYDMNYTVVLEHCGKVQLFFVKSTGNNKIEGSIKDSLTEVAKVLDKLDDKSEITWSQVLNVSIDNIDDLYYFLITCTVDMSKFNK